MTVRPHQLPQYTKEDPTTLIRFLAREKLAPEDLCASHAPLEPLQKDIRAKWQDEVLRELWLRGIKQTREPCFELNDNAASEDLSTWIKKNSRLPVKLAWLGVGWMIPTGETITTSSVMPIFAQALLFL